MNFLRRLFGGAARPEPDNALYLYVQCERCGEVLRVRVDTRNELTPEYGDMEASAYVLRKEMMDSKCFRLMYATIHFDGRRRELSREIEGGKFISREEYERLKVETPSPSS
jgi:hypothetical protein